MAQKDKAEKKAKASRNSAPAWSRSRMNKVHRKGKRKAKEVVAGARRRVAKAVVGEEVKEHEPPAAKDWNHCDESKDGKHEADPRSAQQADETDFVVDYNCKHCGQSGGVRIEEEDIQWG